MKRTIPFLFVIALIISMVSGCGSGVSREQSIEGGVTIWEAIGTFMTGDASQSGTSDNSSENEEISEGKPTSTDGQLDWLLGTWIYTASSGNVGISIMVEFKDDGTFTKGIGSVSGYFYSATAFEGKYEIQGNQIRYYNQMKSTATASSWEELWKMAFSNIKDIPAEDAEESFKVVDQNTLILGDTELSRFE